MNKKYCLTLNQIELLTYKFLLAFNGPNNYLTVISNRLMTELDEIDLIELEKIALCISNKYTVND